MRFVEIETQGESHTAIVNTAQVAFLAEGVYGTSIHFASGEYLVCIGELREVAERLFGGEATGDDYLIVRPSLQS